MRRWALVVLLVVLCALPWLLRGDTRGAAVAPVARAQDIAVSAPATELVDPDASKPRPASASPRDEDSAAAFAPTRQAIEVEVEEPDRDSPNRLEVRVLDVDGSPWADGTLRILAQSSPVLSNDRPLFSPAQGGDPSQAWLSRFQVWELTTEEGTYSHYRTDAEGRVTIPGVTPDLPFALLAIDALGEAGARRDEPPMALGEERSVDVFVTRIARPLTGVCLSESGAPAEDAAVEVRVARGSLSCTTDARGAFETAPLFAERVAIEATHDEAGVATLGDVRPIDGPCVLRLRPARRLEVRLVGERGGRPLLSGMKLATRAGTLAAANPSAPGAPHVFEGVPREPVTLLLDDPRPARRLEVDAESVSVEWSVPELGLLEVEAGEIAGPAGDFLLQVRDRLDSEDSRRTFTLTNTGRQVVRAPLWEGEYDLQVLLRPEDEPERLVPWGVPFGITVRGDETTRTSFGGPQR